MKPEYLLTWISWGTFKRETFTDCGLAYEERDLLRAGHIPAWIDVIQPDQGKSE